MSQSIRADSKEAQAYLIDPLTGADPSDETGLNSHFRSTFAPQPHSIGTPPTSASPKRETNPFRRSNPSSPTSKNPFASSSEVRRQSGSYPSPPTSASPRGEQFPSDHRHVAFSSSAGGPRRKSIEHTVPSAYDKQPARRSRGNSLGERFPGDRSNEPLSILRRESKKAHRSPHLKKQHIPGTDTIDKLDPAIGGAAYHHEGPYDATLLARNTVPELSPVAAVADSTRETLRATPAENIKDSLERHVPLTGVAAIPPGHKDRFGRTYDYKEGDDMMIANGGNYKRWPGVDYAPDDVEGVGEPTYSLDKALREHHIREDNAHVVDGHGASASGIELQEMGTTHNRDIDTRDPVVIAGGQDRYVDLQEGLRESGNHNASGVHRNESVGKKLGEGLKKRIGSLRRKEK